MQSIYLKSDLQYIKWLTEETRSASANSSCRRLVTDGIFMHFLLHYFFSSVNFNCIKDHYFLVFSVTFSTYKSVIASDSSWWHCRGSTNIIIDFLQYFFRSCRFPRTCLQFCLTLTIIETLSNLLY